MPDTVALEWEHEQISGVSAAVSGGRVRVNKCFVIPQAVRTSEGGLDADWLRKQLVQLGIPSLGDVFVTFPRDDGFVRRLELPDAPDNDLPPMVRFQMGAKSSVAMDEQHLDYLPLVKRNEVPGRDVLAATVPIQLVDNVQQQCGSAGGKVVAVTLTTAAIAELVVRAEEKLSSERGGVSLVVGRFGNRLEISVYRLGGLLFSHAARLNKDEGSSEPQSIVPEVSRALVALRGAIADVKIERAWILVRTDEQEVLSTALARRLSCEVQAIDPFQWVDEGGGTGSPNPEIRSQFAGPIGQLLSRVESRVPGLNFLDPRRTIVKEDNRKKKVAYAGFGVGTAIAALIALQSYRVSALETEITNLKYRSGQIDLEIKKDSPLETSVAAVNKWRGESVDWLGRMSDFVQHMPETDRMYLESLQFTRQGNQPPKIVAFGYAREQKDVMDLGSNFHTSDYYRVMPYLASKSGNDSYYPWRIEGQEILVVDPEKEKEAAKASGGKGRKGTGPDIKALVNGSSATQAKGGANKNVATDDATKAADTKKNDTKKVDAKKADQKNTDSKEPDGAKPDTKGQKSDDSSDTKAPDTSAGGDDKKAAKSSTEASQPVTNPDKAKEPIAKEPAGDAKSGADDKSSAEKKEAASVNENSKEGSKEKGDRS